jgi:hypothetical protein
MGSSPVGDHTPSAPEALTPTVHTPDGEMDELVAALMEEDVEDHDDGDLELPLIHTGRESATDFR